MRVIAMVRTTQLLQMRSEEMLDTRLRSSAYWPEHERAQEIKAQLAKLAARKAEEVKEREAMSEVKEIRAALYARKSNTTDDGRTESVDRQLEGGKAFVEAQKWRLVDSFRDDGVSGARFEGRAGLQSLLTAAEAGLFDVVVVHALDRLGRDA